ncbi:glycosyltransferase family 2 protein [Vibrio europaeus]|uniref:glycosyltransferase family 2 protein n=1 Tax=Vibrio europaeus TaxID=300876 RepID=UPI0018A7A265|nr:glycosyltransferase family 2 protein [Vibrio europaeus]MDC5810078.1 glycosyltransferase family 2 protein [Vibrio europaeus]QPG35115.1 glycosyltransferase family 2 protein [Vibrio europaeus]
MIDLLLTILFVVSCLLVIYHHIGYPALLSWYSKQHPFKTINHRRRGFKSIKGDRACATITILVPAFNEEQWIADKIRNLSSLDYPKNKYKVIIACDGCTDNTVSIAEQTIQEAICSDTHFEIRAFESNRGKVTVVNEQMKTITSDITALSDVSALISIDALWVANKHFHNEQVGVVNGHYQLFKPGNEGEACYWQYQSKLKMREATLGSTLGAHGAFYLFRTHLFESMSTDTINDDFMIPMSIVRQGYIAEYEPQMVALEMEATSEKDDFSRRLRISAGNMQQAIELSEMFLPKYKGVAFAFFSGKGLRLITPYLLIFCLISSIVMMDNPIFMAALIAQIALYSLAVLSHQLPYIFSHKACKLLLYIVAGHCANFIGGMRYLFGLESGKWSRVGQ